MVSICAVSMLYGAITIPSPVQGIWICSCIIIVIASVYACVVIWKER